MQVVVMAGGANDFVLGSPPSLEDWRSTYLTFLQNVSHAYILFVCQKSKRVSQCLSSPWQLCSPTCNL